MRPERVAIDSGGEPAESGVAPLTRKARSRWKQRTLTAHGLNGDLVMKPYMKPNEAGSAVRWFFVLFSVNTLVLAASLLILEAIIVSP